MPQKPFKIWVDANAEQVVLYGPTMYRRKTFLDIVEQLVIDQPADEPFIKENECNLPDQ